MPALKGIHGAGLGLRRELLPAARDGRLGDVSFLEVAPENWMQAGGRLGREFRALTERHTFISHGLSLSLGGPAPLDTGFVRRIRKFLDLHGIRHYSEHLSWCADDGHLYELLPIPFTEDAVEYVAARIRRTQDILGREIAVENASLYATPGAEMTELEFINGVLDRAGCGLLLDVNNAWVNGINHGYDPRAFIAGLPAARVRYLHVAGHYAQADDLLVDTHGASVAGPVWELLAYTYARLGPLPTLLERDFNLPPLPELLDEVGHVRRLQAAGR